MEFDEGADAGEAVGVGAEGVRVVAGGLHGGGQGDAVGVAQEGRVGGGEAAGGEAGADAGEAEAGAFLVAEVDQGEGAGGDGAACQEPVEGGEGGDDAEGAVEGAAVGDGVEVRAGDDGLAGARLGPAPDAVPGPLVAVAVDLVGQLPQFGLFAEPGAALAVGAAPGVAPVAAARGVAAEGGRDRSTW
ncbi:hypothetical protein MTP02_20110 [Streptomyces albus]|nr:hypothetical protein MTP02_20110 [Streptomyces albus]